MDHIGRTESINNRVSRLLFLFHAASLAKVFFFLLVEMSSLTSSRFHQAQFVFSFEHLKYAVYVMLRYLTNSYL